MINVKSRKDALIVSPAFFGYERDIVDEFARQGFDTVFVDERPSNSAFARAILRFRRDLVRRSVDRYYASKLKDIGDKTFDIILVVKGEVAPRWFLQELRRRNPQAHFVFYAWDAVENVANCLAILDCFDQLFSFDSRDVETRQDFAYLPLFYTRDFCPPEVSGANNVRRYRLSFIGTLHTERYAFVKRVFSEFTETYSFFYVQARWYFFFIKYLTREHAKVPWRDVSFEKLSREQVGQLFRESKAVLDTPRRGQSGLTMRTFEVLASGAILVTTNAAITREPFYDSGRVVLISGDVQRSELRQLRDRLDCMTVDHSPPQSFQSYSIESWVRTISGHKATGEPIDCCEC